MKLDEEARIAANFERHFEDIQNLSPHEDLGNFSGLGENFELISVGRFPHENTRAYPNGFPKAITVIDRNTGNIFCFPYTDFMLSSV